MAHSAHIFWRLPARHSKAFHQLVGHTRGKPIAQGWGPFNFRIQYTIDFCFRKPLAGEDIDKFGPSELAGQTFDDSNNTRTRGTDSPQDPSSRLTIDAAHK